MPKWIVAVLGLLAIAAARAEEVTLDLGERLTARAEYRPGRPELPAVLLLHGFLQTQDSPTVHQLTDNLGTEGYTVLAPTLSLDVPARRQSLACEAIHTHTLEDALREIGAWVAWLKARHPRIVLLGHSFGSVELLAYVQQHPDKAIRKLIGVSIIEGRYRAGEDARRRKIAELRGLASSAGRPAVVRQQFSFCRQIQGTPQSLLSYLQWSPERILGAARSVHTATTFIVGSRDDLMGPAWIGRLRQTGARVVVIEGANHFMKGEHEFNLLDSVLDELKALP